MSDRKTVIISDSTCDIAPEMIKERDIKIIPLTVVCGDKEFRDSIDITPDDVYEYYKQSGQLAKTTAANIDEHDAFIKENVPEGMDAIYFSISSEFSTSFNNLRLAAMEHDNVYIVDSRNLSTGIGLLVLLAADLADEGKSAKEIQETINSLTANVDASFVVDTLEYLHKGGRCSSVAALGANLLKLKPLIQVKDGKMSVAKKYRGKRNDVLKEYVNEKLSEENEIIGKRIFVTHSGDCDEIAVELRDIVKAKYPDKDVLITRAGCTISVHCGPGTLGVLMIRKNAI